MEYDGKRCFAGNLENGDLLNLKWVSLLDSYATAYCDNLR